MAAPLPWLRSCMCMLTRASFAKGGYSSLVPSVLPSSTTTSSISHGKSTSRTSLIAEVKVASSLYTGIRIESFTVSEATTERFVDHQFDRLQAHGSQADSGHWRLRF